MEDFWKGSVAIIAATVFWAIGGGVFNKLLFAQGFPLVWSSFFGFLVGGLVLFAYSKVKGLRQGKELFENKFFYGLCASSAFVALFSFLSYQSIGIGESAFLQMFSVPLAPLAAWLFLKEKFYWKTMLAVAIALAGLFAINGFSLSFPVEGAFFALASAFAAVSTLLFSRLLKKEFNALLACYVFFAGALLTLPIGLLSAPFPMLTIPVALLLFGLGLVDLALGDGLRIYSVSKTPVHVIGLLELFQAITFPLAGWLAFGESLAMNTLVGGVLVILSGIVVLWGK